MQTQNVSDLVTFLSLGQKYSTSTFEKGDFALQLEKFQTIAGRLKCRNDKAKGKKATHVVKKQREERSQGETHTL